VADIAQPLAGVLEQAAAVLDAFAMTHAIQPGAHILELAVGACITPLQSVQVESETVAALFSHPLTCTRCP
jgi:hypothetical protein